MPITPIFEQPPVAVRTQGIDWTDTIAALAASPGEWARVDGPFPSDRNGQSNCGNHAKSLRKFGDRSGHTIETQRGVVDGENWVYARLVEDQAEAAQPAPAPKPKAETRPLAAAPDPTPPPSDDDDTHPYHCDTCGDDFRTNTRLRQHQANAHKAS